MGPVEKLLRESLSVLKECGWCQRISVDSRGRRCVYGALLTPDAQTRVPREWWGREHDHLPIDKALSLLLAEFAARGAEALTGYQIIPVSAYNDHPTMTAVGVRNVFRGAIRRAMESGQ